MKYYAVRVGKKVGVYTSWSECQKEVNGYPGAQFKSFFSLEEANRYLNVKINEPSRIRDNRSDVPLHNKVKIYTDGSSYNGEGGYGVKIIYQNGNERELFGTVPLGKSGETPTNQRAELYAILISLKAIQTDCVIYTDSMYSISCLTSWIHNWIANDWKNSKGQRVANQDLISEIYTNMQGRNVEFVHVSAHKGITNNERVDFLANQGRLLRS